MVFIFGEEMKNSVGRFIAGRVSTILDNSISPSTLRFYSSHSPPSSSSKLFVAGLSWSVDEKSLKDAFSSFGNVSEGQEASGLSIFLMKMKPCLQKMLWMERHC
ncbi:hypothetical protein E1A91_A08G014100v1 [Gossypium mustelinum]|uniref:RRM domain-containing protein n=1 Tax=Gossypium mustelinum TaxID=34275 RepID=A0A5D2Y3Q7_GOSMU|nr:hypothetical protein E1A91_A08G014100v1 [Gossypium mustelinum]